jgi:hypothetical protein
MGGSAPCIHVPGSKYGSQLKQEKHLYFILSLKDEAFSCKIKILVFGLLTKGSYSNACRA